MTRRENWRHYFLEPINFPDYVCFFVYTAFTTLKVLEYNTGMTDDDRTITSDIVIMFNTVILFCIIIKYLHLIKIFENYGL